MRDQNIHRPLPFYWSSGFGTHMVASGGVTIHKCKSEGEAMELSDRLNKAFNDVVYRPIMPALPDNPSYHSGDSRAEAALAATAAKYGQPKIDIRSGDDTRSASDRAFDQPHHGHDNPDFSNYRYGGTSAENE
jgi:hypothetical protein